MPIKMSSGVVRAAADAEQTREKAHEASQAEDHENVHRHFGDGKVDVHRPRCTLEVSE